MNIATFEDFSFNGSAFQHSPMLLYYGVLEFSNEKTIAMMPDCPFQGEWGEVNSSCLSDVDSSCVPIKIYILYYSIGEDEFYACECDLSQTKLKQYWEQGIKSRLIVGMAPYGKICVWINGENSQILLSTETGFKIDRSTLDSASVHYITHSVNVQFDNKEVNINDLDSLMKQFHYRYLIDFNQLNTNDVLQVTGLKLCDQRYDGTFDRTAGEVLTLYHFTGKPKRIQCEWNLGKTRYALFVWLEYNGISDIFNRFYGMHPETKSDFIIKIDPENKKYELALYRQGLKEPVIIPESAYQLIVFKNKFEDYRSENYNQPRGAWIW